MRSSPEVKEGVVDHVRTVAAFATDLVYPKRCSGCGRRGQWLCSRCAREIACFAPPWCQRCGVPTDLPCQCHSTPDCVANVRSLGSFDGWLRGAVIQGKYHGEWGRLLHLAPRLAQLCQLLRPFDALVPVPLHPLRLRQRGFNQSLVLAQAMAHLLDVPVEEHIVRTRRTHAQVRLAAEDRTRNVAGAMAMKQGGNITDRTFVLVDDVITTGSTLGACAEVLVQAGARTVVAVTICREL